MNGARIAKGSDFKEHVGSIRVIYRGNPATLSGETLCFGMTGEAFRQAGVVYFKPHGSKNLFPVRANDLYLPEQDPCLSK